MKTSLLLPFTLLALSHALSAAQYAVIATVADYPGEINDLRFCNDDGEAVAAMLGSRFGFPKQNILHLKDGQVTTANLRKAIQEHLAAKAKPGDSVVIFYSGHGTQVPDFDGDERDEADEAICTVDMTSDDPDSWFTDDVLRYELSKIQTNRVTVIFDCCHSGTGTRGVLNAQADGVKFLDLGFGRPAELLRNLSISTAMKTPSVNPQHVFLAACASHEVAREDQSRKGGMFRIELLQALEDRGASTPLDKLYDTVRTGVAQRIATGPQPEKKQTPQFEGDARVSLQDLLSPNAPAGTPLAQAPAAPATPPPAPEVTNASNLAGNVGIALSTDKAEYKPGERMKVTLKLEKDAHLRLYYTDSEQRSYLIFPNKFQQDDKVKAGDAIQIPAEGAAFAFEMTFPKERGEQPAGEILTAVASTEPFLDTRSLQWGAFNFIECTGQSYQQMVTRGIDVKPELQPGRATVIYRVLPK